MTQVKNEVLYRLQTDDILGVAKDQHIPLEKITPEVITGVVKAWENALDWYDITATALYMLVVLDK